MAYVDELKVLFENFYPQYNNQAMEDDVLSKCLGFSIYIELRFIQTSVIMPGLTGKILLYVGCDFFVFILVA